MADRASMWRVLAIACALATGPNARADRLASYRTGTEEILLMTELCGAKDSKIQRATKRVGRGELEGCWAVNRRGNPVVMWSDGQVQELDEARVKLAPKYAAMLEDTEAPRAAPPEAAPAADFPRPVWCPDAKFPHERLVCRDPALAAADLALAPLWRSYRTDLKLNEVQQGRVKSDYFRRLKACGANRECIAREQAAQTRFYREALGRP